MTIQTKDLYQRDVNGDLIVVMSDSEVEYLGLCDNRVHWGWYLFWLIVFAPMIIIVLLHDYLSNNHLVRVDGIVYEVTKQTMLRIVGTRWYEQEK